MVHMSVIEARVSQLGVRLSRWFNAELRELQNILVDNEKIIAVVPGRYFAGFALLVATDQRLLLIDKRVLFMTVEDIRYDMISETDFNVRLFDSTVQIFTVNKQHRFTSMKYKRQLRELILYVQQQIMRFRQYGGASDSSDATPAPAAPSYANQPAHKHPGLASTVSHKLPNHMGAAAIWASHHGNPNPYARSSFSIKNQAWLINDLSLANDK